MSVPDVTAQAAAEKALGPTVAEPQPEEQQEQRSPVEAQEVSTKRSEQPSLAPAYPPMETRLQPEAWEQVLRRPSSSLCLKFDPAALRVDRAG